MAEWQCGDVKTLTCRFDSDPGLGIYMGGSDRMTSYPSDKLAETPLRSRRCATCFHWRLVLEEQGECRVTHAPYQSTTAIEPCRSAHRYY